VVVLGILALVLGAVVAPLLPVATVVVVSFAGGAGVSALAFEHLFGLAGADPALPLWRFVFLVALGTDDNLFLMTRVHEEAKGHGTRRGRWWGWPPPAG
jgi:putative drug exporter of the RND superfamily